MPHTLFKSVILIKVVFDSDRSTVIVYHSSDAHICSDKYMLTDKIEHIITNGVVTVDRKYLIAKNDWPI